MTALQLALVCGAVVGLGVAGVVYALTPAQPDLGDVLARLSPPSRRTGGIVDPQRTPSSEERLGIWAERTLPARLLGVPPAADLAVLRRTPAQFYGRKVLYGLVGLLLPATMTAFFALIGIHLPAAVPVGGTLALGALMFAAPSRDVAAEAKKAREDCVRALTAFIELCALERNNGAGSAVALASAAQVGDAWVFARIREELARARYNGQPAWDALQELSRTLDLPELADVADIMRLAGDENSEVYRSLRARSGSMRSALLSEELARANVVEERMWLPGSFLGLVFLGLLLAPSLMRLFSM